MKQLAQNINIGGKAFPTIQSIQPVVKLDEKGLFGGNILMFGVQVLLTVAIIISLFSLVWAGIQWTMSEGNKQKLEAVRSRVIFSILGLIISLMAFTIVFFVTNFFGVPCSNC